MKADALEIDAAGLPLFRPDPAVAPLAFDFLGSAIEKRKIQIIELVSVPPLLWLEKTTLESKMWINYK
jgi:hypothetical protein